MKQLFQYTFSNGLTAKAIQVDDWPQLPEALYSLGFTAPCPTLVLVGGASKMSETDYLLLETIFTKIIAPLAESLKITVIDGGTDAGIMRLMGNARTAIKGTFPLVGVAAYGTIVAPGKIALNRDAASLDPHHSHFIIVPGYRWGDESRWLARIASLLTKDLPSVTLVINGGEITWHDVTFSIRENRPTLILAGSGRTADQIAAALRGESGDARTDTLIASGLVQAIDIDHTQELNRKLTECFNALSKKK
ncbi:conserved hypothetical protein [Gloeothece citriformis PCC 7424]|uniref:LSDAT prokaryote domain-containing protein n=1 Tax=Gloeothece citriformis (strain PCC 7424) TaxID=65393 RepID=B7KEH5_GLOC7|nr:hypothetical protein [Gloeothece citriformis]ACK73293.1 conserved hypothetical protein [Gloeothece citriformis PCC 7424]